MMKKEDFHEDQLVVSLNKEGERRPQLYRVLEVHDSHIVLMSPWEGLDAVFYNNPRTIYVPATRAELVARHTEVMHYLAELRTKTEESTHRADELQEAIDRFDATNR